MPQSLYKLLKPTQDSPGWYLWLYPHFMVLRYDPKMFFLTLIGQGRWAWRAYEWEKEEFVDEEQDRAYRRSKLLDKSNTER